MKGLTILSAALVAAPMCMVAQALDAATMSTVNQMFSALDAISSTLENVTPSTADRACSQLDAAAKQLQAAIAAGNKLSAAQNRALENDAAVNQRLQQAQSRMMNAAQAFLTKAQNASPADQAQYKKVADKMSSIFN